MSAYFQSIGGIQRACKTHQCEIKELARTKACYIRLAEASVRTEPYATHIQKRSIKEVEGREGVLSSLAGRE